MTHEEEELEFKAIFNEMMTLLAELANIPSEERLKETQAILNNLKRRGQELEDSIRTRRNASQTNI